MSIENTHFGAVRIGELLAECKSIYFIGVGGVNMSSLALISLKQGYLVGGSDRVETPLTKSLEEKGIKGRDEPDLAGVCVFTEQIQHQTDGEPVKEQQFREWEEPDQRHHPEGAEMDQFPENFLRIRDRDCRRVFSHYLLKTQILRLQGGLQIQPAPGLLPPCRRGRQRWR